ncbi:hypothetical protein NQ176_g2494 [Zarea fungicola]|uniref:Uncharacterized protein n=1 Tax=Zarea fungicola TaxID=93591 RepID=A0ACC1NNM8_9HYPO|nr:hypothetical protein NQ176_g2494 [Lecanicillium fungicola]
MAIAALRTLATQVPNWQTRLDNLVADITARQADLAKSERSAHHAIPALEETPALAAGSIPRRLPVDNMDTNSDFATSALGQQQTSPRPRTGKPPKAGPVYFDGAMQKFFEELVHFIAVSRNMMRKAKMAARVAQIKKMAEIEIKDDVQDGDDAEAVHALRSASSRRLEPKLSSAAINGSLKAQGGDVFDKLDKSLDTLQSTSELAAFQFLRAASNNKHMQSIEKLLTEVLDTSITELARLEREEPAMVKDADGATARTKRPLSVRKELPAGAKITDAPNKRQNTGQLTPSTSLPSIGHMEVDVTALQNRPPAAPHIVHLQTNIPAQ